MRNGLSGIHWQGSLRMKFWKSYRLAVFPSPFFFFESIWIKLRVLELSYALEPRWPCVCVALFSLLVPLPHFIPSFPWVQLIFHYTCGTPPLLLFSLSNCLLGYKARRLPSQVGVNKQEGITCGIPEARATTWTSSVMTLERRTAEEWGAPQKSEEHLFRKKKIQKDVGIQRAATESAEYF
jgi:hypothetical protein